MFEFNQSIYLIIKYLKYILLLNLNFTIIFSYHFFIKKLKFEFKCYIFCVSMKLCIGFEIRTDICIISSNFKES